MDKQSHTPSHFPALDRAIKKHQAAFEAWSSSTDDDPEDTIDEEIAARHAIATRRFKSDAEFLAALRYLVAAESKIWRAAELDHDFGATIGAVAKFFGVPIAYFEQPLS
jgi:hypothetical protein